MKLKELKKAVAAHFPGKAQGWISGKVKEMTNGGDLRKIATWQYALDLLTVTDLKIEPVQEKQQRIPVAVVESVKVDLDNLPLREIRPGVWIFDRFAA